MILSVGKVIKAPWEEIYRVCQFRRPDGKGWLNDMAIIEDAYVIVEPLEGGDPISEMVDNVAPYDQTQVRYRLKGGLAGNRYTIRIRALDSNGQKLEARATLKVI